ncbi:MAG TPA: hypothetical protein VGR89_10925 [Puia sp.]|nr:hypothetical protein [Puia sp.]
MRTSIRLFLGSIGLLGIGLLVYDLKLMAEFRKGDYSRPFYDYERLPFTGFDRIQLNSATALTILVVKGDFDVKVNPRLTDLITVQQNGGQLEITAHFPERINAGPNYSLFVSCPSLRYFETSGKYYLRDQLVQGNFLWQPWYQPTVLKGFRLDSLSIAQRNGGEVLLQDDRMRSLHALVGTGSRLTIDQGNAIGGGDISVMDYAQLTLSDTNSLKPNRYLADSATLILSGAVAKQLLKLKQP